MPIIGSICSKSAGGAVIEMAPFSLPSMSELICAEIQTPGVHNAFIVLVGVPNSGFWMV